MAAPLIGADTRLVFRWDLDKTYILSDFDSLRELVKIPFEKAEDKVAAPGVAALIRGLREAALGRGRSVGVYFISASPPQIGREIRKKLALDGIVYDGIVFKDQLHRLVRGKFRHLREQVGYKLTELLKARRAAPVTAREYLFGDDWESDPLIYSLYADVVAGRVAPAVLDGLLRTLRVDPPLVEQACALAGAIEPVEAVGRIFINLERRTPPARLRVYGSRLVPAFNYLQTAAGLFEEGLLASAGVVAVAHSLVEESAYKPEQLTNSLADIVRRGCVRPGAAAELRRALASAGLLPAGPPLKLRERLRRWWERQRTPGAAAISTAIDYGTLVKRELPAEGGGE